MAALSSSLDGPNNLYSTPPPLSKRCSPLNKLGKAIDKVVDKAGKAGQDAIDAVRKSLVGAAKTIGVTVEDVGDAFADGVMELSEPLRSAGRDLVADISVPFYDASVNAFDALNPKSKGEMATQDQKYSITPLLGNIYDDEIRIFYNANFAPGFNANGVTMGGNIYVHTLNAPKGDPRFKDVLKLIIHEMVHCTQYRSFGWDTTKFGRCYLYGYCIAGFSYANNKFEVEARRFDGPLDRLLDDTGMRFFNIWRNRNLQTTLGYPSATYVSLVEDSAITELQFQNAMMLVDSKGCFKILTQAESQARAAAKCAIQGVRCDGSHVPRWCDPQVFDDNKMCGIARNAWRLVRRQGFDCNLY